MTQSNTETGIIFIHKYPLALKCSPVIWETEVQGRVISMIQKMVLDASLLNTKHYKTRIKGTNYSFLILVIYT